MKVDANGVSRAENAVFQAIDIRQSVNGQQEERVIALRSGLGKYLFVNGNHIISADAESWSRDGATFEVKKIDSKNYLFKTKWTMSGKPYYLYPTMTGELTVGILTSRISQMRAKFTAECI